MCAVTSSTMFRLPADYEYCSVLWFTAFEQQNKKRLTWCEIEHFFQIYICNLSVFIKHLCCTYILRSRVLRTYEYGLCVCTYVYVQ